ncbi:MAG: DNA translocase FtsK [Bacteroidales bacterium]|nr:DNA translocase FtsK [Bacteroidales bacterium]
MNMDTIHMLFGYLGYAGLILLLIPLAILVRLLVKKSRWSLLRVTLVSIVGVAVSALWLHYGESVTGAERMGGKLGTQLATLLETACKGPKISFFVSSALFFLWIVWASMDAVIATARFFINKPYIREIVKEKIVEVEKPVASKPKKETRPQQSGGLQKSPARHPAERPKPAVSKSEDDVPDFKTPSATLLKDRSHEHRSVPKSEIDRNIAVIRETLADHHVKVADIDAVPGPTVTLYKVYPAKGVKVSAIRGLSDDISVALKAESVMASILKDCVGFEVANQERSSVSVRELVTSEEFLSSQAELPIAIGKKITGDVKVFDLADAPHLLVAGATKQGKSVGLNVIVTSLLYAKRPSELKLVFIDPKKTEFGGYSRLLNHYLAVTQNSSSEDDEKARAVVKTAEDADYTLKSLCQEMNDRYSLLEKAGTPNLLEYLDKWNAHKLNPQNGHHFLPYIVVIIDEYSQLVLGTGGPDAKAHARSIMTSIISLAQMGRACGIHLIIATQTPRREVVSGMIKANFPMSIAFKTKTQADSQVIMDQGGAEDLIGKGDMLLSVDASTERIQCGYISSAEIEAMTKAIEAQKGYHKSFSTPYYLPEVKEEGKETGMVDMKKLDERFEEAARLVVNQGRASTSYLQTALGMGFAKSARVMSQLEAAGIVGPQDGSKMREVLVSSQAELDSIIQAYKKG